MTSPQEPSLSGANEPGQQPPDAAERQLSIERIYVKDLSFESPNAPQIFTEDWKPDVNINLTNDANRIAQDLYSVNLVVTVTVKNGDSTAFLVEVHQGGVFHITGFQGPELGQMLGSYCPNILFPYVREVVSDLVSRGGFPQFLLSPVNFDALYAQHLRQNSTQAAEGPGASRA